MPFIAREEPFTCDHCGADVQPLGRGTYRNHCPQCLHSKHVDRDGPGDRASVCHGLMKPTGLDHRSGKGWMIRHECDVCGKVIVNKPAPDDQLDLLLPSEA